jgi:hypothetical protein
VFRIVNNYHHQSIGLFVLVYSLLFIGKVEAQQSGVDNLNLGGGTSGGGSGGSNLLPDQRDLLGMVMRISASNNRSQGGRVMLQNGFINFDPTYVKTISTGLKKDYLRPEISLRKNYDAAKKYRNATLSRIYPLNVDPQDMELEALNLWQFGGINILKPQVTTSLSYDTNSSNLSINPKSISFIHTTQLGIPFNYGTNPGSATLFNLQYSPSYLNILAGDEQNQLEHQIEFEAGRVFGRSALGFNNETAITSAPIRELSGRAKTITNVSRLLGAYDYSPKSLISYGFGHSFSTRSDSNQSSSQSIVVDDTRLFVLRFSMP